MKRKQKDRHKIQKSAAARTAPKVSSLNKKTNNEFFWLAGILLLTLIVFLPSLDNGLTNWDDPKYLTDNPLIRKLSWENIRRIFTEVYFGNYQPLHIFSYAVEYHFYKLNPAGYHATSVVMHLIATALVYFFIRSLSENQSVALIAALLFGIHPLHVESVAWAAERKDLLYAIFFIGSLILYVRYIKEGKKLKFFLFSFLLFALSIFSKAMAASLPPVLILLDIYFSRKWSWKLVLEKIPFFALAGLFGYIAAHTVSSTGQVSLNAFSLPERMLIASFNLLAYVAKLLLPVQLSSFYPYPRRVDGNLQYYFFIAPVVVIGLLVLVFRSLKQAKVLFFGAGFFVACIFLVLQLFPVGPTIISERYSYLPSIGFFFVVAWFIHRLVTSYPSKKALIALGLGAYCIFLSAATYARCDVWKDSITLWSNVLEQFPHVGIALNNRGNIYGKERGELDRALQDFDASIKYDPRYENAYVNRGIVYCLRRQFDLAIADFNKALELKPDYFDARYNRGIAYGQTGQIDKAISDFNELEKGNETDERIFLNRGTAYAAGEQFDKAIEDFTHAIQLKPDYMESFYNRAVAYYNTGRYQLAYSDIRKAAELGYPVDQQNFEILKAAAESSPAPAGTSPGQNP